VSRDMSRDIMKGVSTLLKSPIVNLQSLLRLHYSLNEYQIPLRDQVVNNGQIDIHTVNIPESVITLSKEMIKFDKKRKDDSSQVPYVFYGILPPGYH